MIRTSGCEVLGTTHPIVQAGMSRQQTNAELVAAVSAAGGLGILGCLGRPAHETVSEIRRIRALTERPFGVNFVLHRLDEETFTACLAERVPVFSFFRGDPADAVARAHDAGAVTIHQVTAVEEARQACAAGTDVLVAQGTEAGGHQGHVPLLSLLPGVVEVAETRPVLAAGGIVDGRGLAAALCLGASGALIGTRFLATPECPASATHKRAILRASAGGTVASSMFDIIWGEEWPGVGARALRNKLTDRWQGREQELRRVRTQVLDDLQRAEAAEDPDEMILLAGEGAGRIQDIRPAGEVVRGIAAKAARVLQDWGERAGRAAT